MGEGGCLGGTSLALTLSKVYMDQNSFQTCLSKLETLLSHLLGTIFRSGQIQGFNRPSAGLSYSSPQ